MVEARGCLDSGPTPGQRRGIGRRVFDSKVDDSALAKVEVRPAIFDLFLVRFKAVLHFPLFVF